MSSKSVVALFSGQGAQTVGMGKDLYDTFPAVKDMFDRAGRTALVVELDLIRSTWPDTDLLVLRPDDRVLEESRPNPMSVEAAIPSFLVTLRSMRDELAHSSTWELLEKHLVTERKAS